MSISAAKPLFIVFTPTYNRGDLLERVYALRLAQTPQDFEWLIVDDGSIDDTSRRVEAIIATGKFPIHYIFKQNSGVHTAHNTAIWLRPASCSCVATATRNSSPKPWNHSVWLGEPFLPKSVRATPEPLHCAWTSQVQL